MEASSHPQLQYNTEKVAEAKTDHNIDRLDYLSFSDSEAANHFVCSSYHRVGETLTGKMCVLTQQDSEIRLTQLSDEFKFGIFSQSVRQIAPNSCSIKVGCSDAHFRVFTLSNSDDGVTLNQDKDLQIKEYMILNHHESEFGEYAFAMDSGDLIVYDVETDQEKFSQSQAHEYQAWTVFCDPYQQNIVYTGADDTKFKGWDLRVSGVPTFTSKEHEYGVTCIRDWLGDSHYLVTGKSYSDVQAPMIRNSDFGTKEHSKHQQRLWISGCKFGISSITKILKTNSRM
ncbi:unnamed protein product [Moneuplotes crassus]|uniref:Uncharacterized protein n=1 Tax=Euplotes crassus TaxID=5936 RepID=A0AAD1UUM0_EUPCR|nr:unnamed protein product [Moneuplotes crassus]